MGLEKRTGGILWRQQLPKLKTFRRDGGGGGKVGALEGDWKTKGHFYKTGDARDIFEMMETIPLRRRKLRRREESEVLERWERGDPELDLGDLTRGPS